MPDTLIQDRPYNPDAIFDLNGPLDPAVMEDAVATIMRATQVELSDTPQVASRRMWASMRALAALHPRNEPELMLGVQALSAYHAANAGWRRGASGKPDDDVRRHVASAASAARAFDSMLRALERRQAKPLSVPIGRPEPREWGPKDTVAVQGEWKRRCGVADTGLFWDSAQPDYRGVKDHEMITDMAARNQHWLENPNEGLDIENTAGILPDGSMVMPLEPTPQQAAYIDRRLALAYIRELEENRRNGVTKKIRFRGVREGEIVH